MKKSIFFLSLSLLLSQYSHCQVNVTQAKDSVLSNIVEQIVIFPQEKLYLQTDKPLYISGETVWFRAWLVDAVLHKPLANKYVYVELINPLDSVVNRLKIRQDQGAFSGYIPLDENLPEGDYTLCGYTDYMQNLGEDFFFRKYIRIISPLSASIKSEAEFIFDRDDRLTAEVSFSDIITRKKIKYDQLKIRVNDQPASEVKTGNDTMVHFSFRLPAETTPRVLTVETVKGTRLFPIPYPTDDFEVTFYPEGGYMLQGVPCTVAFKALNSRGLPENVTVKIVNGNGFEYGQVKTTHDGMGLFSIVAKEGEKYYAICTDEQGHEKRFELPEAASDMYSISTETVKNNLYVSVLKSTDIQEECPLFLLLHTRGIVLYAAPWDPDYSSIMFDTDKFPSGVMQIILFDCNMNPLSERLVFCLNNDQAHVELNTDLQNYKSRQKVNAGVKITDINGIPREGTFSVSVTDDNDIKPDSSASILTNLLLTSDLKGYINNPAYYFRENNPEAAEALDLLMLTNGWRRYNIPDAVNGKFTTPVYPERYGMEIKGRTRSMVRGKPVAEGLVAIFSWEAGYYDETATDLNGRFAFNGIEFPDSSSFILQALDKKGSKGIELLIEPDKFPRVSALPPLVVPEFENRPEEKHLSSYVSKADTKYTIENGMRTIYIEEVVITGKAPGEKDYRFSYYMPKNSPEIMTSEEIEAYQPSNVSDLLKYIPHVDLVTDEFGQRKVILGRMSYRLPGGPSYNYAALIIDDLIIQDYDIDNIIDPSNIERIGVLKGAQATLLGGDGAGGAIVITTKTGYQTYDNAPKYNIRKITPLGYQKPDLFYSPRYDTPELRENRQADLRTTIYWNPNVTVSSSGEAMFDFYTADSPTTYSVVIEGVTSDGTCIHGSGKISRR